MNFIYPAIIRKTEKGYQTLDLARHEMEDWIRAEFEEEEPEMPPISDPDDIELADGEFVRNILVIYRFYDGWDE